MFYWLKNVVLLSFEALLSGKYSRVSIRKTETYKAKVKKGQNHKAKKLKIRPNNKTIKVEFTKTLKRPTNERGASKKSIRTNFSVIFLA